MAEQLLEEMDTHDPVQVRDALQRLDIALTNIDDQIPSPWNHWRQIPPSVQQGYEYLLQGAQLVHATSTKYSLLAKLDEKEHKRMLEDILKGCQYIGTATIIISDQGCATVTRHFVKQAARAVIRTTIQLVEAFINKSAFVENVGAQKTGIVWQACDTIINKQIPQGNRNAVRRTIFTFVKECNETMQEFQEMIDNGPATSTNDTAAETSQWDAFLQGQEDQYTETEIPIATAALAIVKCSRGTINVSLQVLEAVGEHIDPEQTSKLEAMKHLFESVNLVGNGMTDLGSVLYPPMNINNVWEETQKQAKLIINTLELIQTMTLDDNDTIPAQVKEMTQNLRQAIDTRLDEVKGLVDEVNNE